MSKREICKKLYMELGDNELSNIILDTLIAPKKDVFLFNEKQVQLFEKYAKEFNIDRKTKKEDFYWVIL